MKFNLFSIFWVALFSAVITKGAQQPTVPIKIHIQRTVRVPLTSASPSTIKALQQAHKLPANSDDIQKVILMNNGRLYGAIRVQDQGSPGNPGNPKPWW